MPLPIPTRQIPPNRASAQLSLGTVGRLYSGALRRRSMHFIQTLNASAGDAYLGRATAQGDAMSTLNVLLLALGLSSTANAHPGRGHGGYGGGHHHTDALGRVVVINNSGGSVRFTLDNGESIFLANGDRTMLRAQAGGHNTRATYRVFGMVQDLESERIFVRPYQTTVVELDPERDALVKVTNDTRHYADLTSDGRFVTQLSPGETEFVRLPVGGNRLQLTSRGRVLGEKYLRTQAFSENQWTLCLPSVADVTVVNPLPIPVRLTGERGRSIEVAAYGRTTYEDVPFGSFTLTATRTSGEFVDQQTISVREFGRNVWTVDAPMTGFVMVDSDLHCGSQVRVDGQVVARLGGDERQRLELSVGSHRITITDDRGRKVEDEWVNVDPYRMAQVDAGRDHHAVVEVDREDDRGDRGDRGDRSDRDDRAQEEAQDPIVEEDTREGRRGERGHR